jgi:hypothetical protein
MISHQPSNTVRTDGQIKEFNAAVYNIHIPRGSFENVSMY